jgi:hypothetical protein
MIKFAADENFNNAILRGLLRKMPELDIVRVQDSEISGASDPEVLEWADRENRVLLTHDVQTLTKYAYERVRKGLPMPGVFEVSRVVPIAQIIDDILLLAECSQEGEWEGQIRYLPLH